MASRLVGMTLLDLRFGGETKREAKPTINFKKFSNPLYLFDYLNRFSKIQSVSVCVSFTAQETQADLVVHND